MVVAAEDRGLSEAQPDAPDPIRAGGERRSPACLSTAARPGPPRAPAREDSRLSGPGGSRSERFAAPQPPLTDAATALLQAIREHLVQVVHFAGFVLEELHSRRWASVTFQGARHRLAFRLEGEGAEAAASRFLSGLQPRDFPLRGHLLADLSLIEEERRPDWAHIRLEALTVEEK